MVRTTDPVRIRAILQTDPRWAVYALGDLAPGFFEHCEWLCAPDRAPGLLLLYRAFAPPVLFALGEADTVAPLLDEIRDVPALSLHIPVHIVPLVKERWHVRTDLRMWRMVLDPAAHRPPIAGEVVRLGAGDIPALEQLYADGDANGEAPDFFHASMVERGVFFGVRDGSELIAAAGTHLMCPSEGVAAVGNIYTRRDRRRRGLAARLTNAVAAELLERDLRTVALNVNQQNAVAIRLYERLGFERYCAFHEGVAER